MVSAFGVGEQIDARHRAPQVGASGGAFLTALDEAGAEEGAEGGPLPTTGASDSCAVTALCFVKDEKMLFWGDDLGRICAWNLANLVHALPLPQRSAGATAAFSMS